MFCARCRANAPRRLAHIRRYHRRRGTVELAIAAERLTVKHRRRHPPHRSAKLSN